MLQLKYSLTSTTAQAFLPRKLLFKTWEFDLIPCFLCGCYWFEWLFFPLNNFFFPLLLGLFKVPLIPWRNCWAQPHPRWSSCRRNSTPKGALAGSDFRCVTRRSSGRRPQWFPSTLHQEEHLQITKHDLWPEGKEPLLNSYLNNHPSKGSFTPWDPALSYTKWTHGYWMKVQLELLSYHHQL